LRTYIGFVPGRPRHQPRRPQLIAPRAGAVFLAGIMEIETGIVATGIAVNITGAVIMILTGLDGASGFASRMKTATSTAGIANRSSSLYVNEMKNPPGLKPGGFHLSSSGCAQR
jgi:hypothetical protein